MEHRWNDTDRERRKYSEKNPSNCHFANNRLQVNWPGLERALQSERQATIRRSHGYAMTLATFTAITLTQSVPCSKNFPTRL